MEPSTTKPEHAPLSPAEAPASAAAPGAAEALAPTEAPTPAEPAPSEAPAPAEAPAQEGTPAPQGAASAPAEAPAPEAAPAPAGQPASEPTPEPAPEPENDPRYDNKYAKRHRADLDRMAAGPEKNYLLDRVFPQMQYYSKRSAAYKKTYHLLTMLCIIFNGVIPFVMLFENCACLAPYIKYAVTALSSAAGILTAIVALKQHRELWVQYRVCLEQLKRAVSMYFLGVGDFAQDQKPEDRARTLFAVCENILSAEHKQWTELNQKQDK